jgi:hypothetical protein
VSSDALRRDLAEASAAAGSSASTTATPADVATYAFRLVATRTPRPDEVARIVASFTQQLDRFRKDPGAAARVVKGSAVEGTDPAEQAAWTLVANALLNLDEAITKE